MSSSGANRSAEEIFFEASRLPRESRQRFVESACGGKAALRAEVGSLLAAWEQRPQILDSGELASRIPDRLGRHPERIGDFRVTKILGEGGMGVVYKARQERPIRRSVAIKLIRHGFETPELLARFESERQALALMTHPSIAQVHDAGFTDDGTPYIAMEYVDGPPITDWCDRRLLPLRQRLELFTEVCHGVQHAHQKAIIHRDLKPSNVLVTDASGKPLPKIIDFGVAKPVGGELSGKTAFTRLGQLVGTPEYMSPEQAGGDGNRVDTRTDVYSLGALLYELLTGERPFESSDSAGGSDSIRRQILADEPKRPSVRVATSPRNEESARIRATDPRALARSLRGDLDWIVGRAMAKEPDRRYASANDMAMDIGRYLRNEPVLANPPSRSYRFRKFVAKHRAAVLAGAAAVLSLVAVAAVLGVQAGRISIERNRADAAATRAVRKAAAARQVSEFLVQVFDFDADPEAAREQLDAALVKIQRDHERDPVTQARLKYPLGQIYDNLGFPEGASLMLESEQQMRALLGDDDPEVLAAIHARAVRLARARHLDEAVPLMQSVVEARKRTLGEHHRDTLNAMGHLARCYEIQGRFAEAEALLYETFDKSLEVLGEADEVTLRAEGYIANLRLRQGRIDEAEGLYRDTYEKMRRHLGPSHQNTLAVLYRNGCIHALQGRTEAAIEAIHEAVTGGWVYAATGQPMHVAVRDDPRLPSLKGEPRFEAIVGPKGYLTALDRARELAWDRKLDDALGSLEVAIERGYRSRAAILQDQKLAPLHQHPGFQSLLSSLDPVTLSTK